MKRGDQILCIDDKDVISGQIPKGDNKVQKPEKYKPYTVRKQVVSADGSIGFKLKEIVNKKVHHDVDGLREPIFSESKFEPIYELWGPLMN
ncbi:hypothetical protein COB64_03195 [Candidatus Wolfebacteria bacterium]|nr:MAG: hypothetical protein COB64_03195 [Candidatus Wolfebacteria bacterium]